MLLLNSVTSGTPEFPQNPDDQPLPGPLAGRFGTAQLEDPNLTSALQQVSDGKLMDGVRQLSFPHFTYCIK